MPNLAACSAVAPPKRAEPDDGQRSAAEHRSPQLAPRTVALVGHHGRDAVGQHQDGHDARTRRISPHGRHGCSAARHPEAASRTGPACPGRRWSGKSASGAARRQGNSALMTPTSATSASASCIAATKSAGVAPMLTSCPGRCPARGPRLRPTSCGRNRTAARCRGSGDGCAWTGACHAHAALDNGHGHLVSAA